MSVTLIATVVALVLGHLAQPLAAAVRSYGWYGDWLRWLDGRFDEGSLWRGSWGILIALLPPLLLVALFQQALDDTMFGLASLVFGIAALFYAWGPRDLDVDVEAIVQAPDLASRREAAARLWPDGGSPSLEGGVLVDAVFYNALRRWFGVLFWFLLLGPFGALMYRLVEVSAHGEFARTLPAGTAEGARTLLTALEWPVAQLMTLALAIVGNFDTVLAAWRDNGGATLAFRIGFLGAVGRASVRSELAEEVGDYADVGVDGEGAVPRIEVLGELPELRDAMSLVWRTLLAWLALLALLVIAGYVN
ncbi:hypothetical protein [Marilutibacter spongiae]|uniref:Regulatory signaling modulator protein AmpE n=1 Tax=Marilutibacter spongiae TaxID=2025720 RepID=A0A7W3TPT2_9GAMM|nr:hypothetical protein [Lysobacter spongiae]MBB1062151.1 hypothetical protein [Lysobacter spongiae]